MSLLIETDSEFRCIHLALRYDSIVQFDRIGMAGKQAKVLVDHHVQALLAYATGSRYPVRNRVIVLLSVKAGLRAGEIANLTWPMVVDPTGRSRRISSSMMARPKTGAVGGSPYTMTCGKGWRGRGKSATAVGRLFIRNAAAG